MRLSETEWYLNDFLIFCQSKNLSQKTISSYEQSLNLFLLWLKNEQDIEEVQRVKTGHIRQYIAYMQKRGKYTVVKREESLNTNHPYNRKDYNKTISNVTINNYIRNIKVFFNWLHDEGEIRKNPVDGIKTIKTERKQKVGITKQEFQKLLDAFDYTKYYGYRNKMIILLLQDTGARIGEALAIDTEDIDFKHRMILMRHTKSRQERYVYFSQQLARELKHYIQFKDRFTDSSLLFTTTRGTPVTVSSFEKQLKKT